MLCKWQVIQTSKNGIVSPDAPCPRTPPGNSTRTSDTTRSGLFSGGYHLTGGLTTGEASGGNYGNGRSSGGGDGGGGSGGDAAPGGLDTLCPALKDLFGDKPTTEEQENASRIAQSIQQYWKNHATAWKISNCFKDKWPTSERCAGYWCYQWAFGFESAIRGPAGPHFACRVEYAATPSGAVHAWVSIWSVKNPEKRVYVDDGYGNGYQVNTDRPIPDGYKYQGEGFKGSFGKHVPIPGYMPPM
jgi:hypothetical protein